MISSLLRGIKCSYIKAEAALSATLPYSNIWLYVGNTLFECDSKNNRVRVQSDKADSLSEYHVLGFLFSVRAICERCWRCSTGEENPV